MKQPLQTLGRWASTTTAHSPLEDAQGIFTGVVLAALGVAILQHLGLLTGGTAGLSLIVHYWTGWNFGVVFFVVNLPFYALAIGRMGLGFTLKTFAAVGLLSLVTAVQPSLFTLGEIEPFTGAILGGLTIGLGLLLLFRHRSSLGGVGILAVFCQDRFGWRAGLVQLAVDLCILALSFTVAEPPQIALSVLGALVLNLLLAINHRTDRYVAQ
ncbi:YitT family protein [Consotaella aegiceratis]|uniref:YitT family protein n=1 Tax=Consotaella aegiceratis TaxID=3097961 RepID=UPI002F422D99